MSRGPQKQFDRDEVLDRAMAHFWANGYEGSGMAALIESMGIGRQSLYDTFGDKRSLFLEALSRYFRAQVGPMLALLRSAGSPLGNLRKVFQAMQEMAAKSESSGCMAGNSLAEFGQHDEDVSRIIRGYFGALEDGFCDAFERAKEAGELRTQIPPRDLARLLVCAGQGLALMSKLDSDASASQSVFATLLRILEGEPVQSG